MTRAGFPHSEILGSQLGWQLPQAYRGLLRPSSAPGAKASTVRSRQLDHKDARVHCAILKQRPAPAPHCRPHPENEAVERRNGSGTRRHKQRLFLQDPTGCPAPKPPPDRSPFHATHRNGGRTRQHEPSTVLTSQRLRPLSTPSTHSADAGSWTLTGQVLLRKEVIQPHLPVRLPCYDFVPIASPTFDGSLPKGLGHRLRVLPTFVT